MKVLRALAVVAILVVAALALVRFFSPRTSVPSSLGVYYVRPDGTTLVKWDVSVSPSARDARSVAFYATAQAVAGPAPDTDAVRFPTGTIVRSVHVAGETATVDLGGSIEKPQDGSLTESAEFKALVWTLTALPGIARVQIEIDGARAATLPGGHFELDEPLSRHTF